MAYGTAFIYIDNFRLLEYGLYYPEFGSGNITRRFFMGNFTSNHSKKICFVASIALKRFVRAYAADVGAAFSNDAPFVVFGFNVGTDYF